MFFLLLVTFTIFYEANYFLSIPASFIEFSFNFFSILKNIGLFELYTIKLNSDLSNYLVDYEFYYTYLTTYYNQHIKPYSFDKIFGDANFNSLDYARGLRAREGYVVLFTYTFESSIIYDSLSQSPVLIFFFKKNIILTFYEIIAWGFYFSLIYFFSWVFVKSLDDIFLSSRETDDFMSESSAQDWFYSRENRRGVVGEYTFLHPDSDNLTSPLVWDRTGWSLRIELIFHLTWYYFVWSWAIVQGFVSTLFYDNAIDLHYSGWFEAIFCLFVLWRVFYYPQRFLYFNRFKIRNLFYYLIRRIFNFLILLILRICFKFLSFFYIFGDFMQIKELTIKSYKSKNSLFYPVSYLLKYSSKSSSESNRINFIKTIYFSNQLDKNYFNKINFNEKLLLLNLNISVLSKTDPDNLNYWTNVDPIYNRSNNYVNSYISNYRYNMGYYSYKSIWRKGPDYVRARYQFFPYYLNYYNVLDLPIWGALDFYDMRFFSNLPRESSEVWFLSRSSFFNWFKQRLHARRVQNLKINYLKQLYVK